MDGFKDDSDMPIGAKLRREASSAPQSRSIETLLSLSKKQAELGFNPRAV
jgi:hypothetical protein